MILDYKMPGMNGVELIKLTREYLTAQDVPPEEMPKFAFRAQQFFELPLETIEEIFDLGIKG